MFAMSHPLVHPGDLSADDLRLSGRGQPLILSGVKPLVSRVATSSRSIRATSTSDMTPASDTATSFSRQTRCPHSETR